ncbi:hypothetical protein [Bradyrhizobium vignae]|uniref:hypothetical protein n=1 Tax=Bradyrhizobium vignae TaxID=1549949 RepID=UPI00100B1A61|nr:hypothetical protein [Bradyrhizobium vignae]RXG90916.1 hypothetical protein EAV90_28545 [Bradyrhizobium vignae]
MKNSSGELLGFLMARAELYTTSALPVGSIDKVNSFDGIFPCVPIAFEAVKRQLIPSGRSLFSRHSHAVAESAASSPITSAVTRILP